MNDCIFCKIVKGDIPSFKVYEDDLVYAFLDINPMTKGHTVIIPKKHYKNIYEITEDDMAEFSYAIPLVAKKLKEKLNPIGLTILNNNERPDQSVEHLHIHLIPRYEDDTFNLDFSKTWTNDMDKIKEVYKTIMN